MKTNRILTIIAALFLALPFSSHAQFFKELGKELGNAVVNGVKEGLKGDNNSNQTQLQDEDMPASNRPAPVEGTKIVTNHPDLKIKIKRCEVNGKTCVIDLIMTNYGADTEIILTGSKENSKSTAFDDEANEYSIAVQATNSNLTGFSVRVDLLTDVPIKARIQIENVSPAATMFKRIHLLTQCESLGLNWNKPIMFYNIPISREGDE